MKENQEIIQFFSQFTDFVQFNKNWNNLYVSNTEISGNFKGVAFDIITQEIYCIVIKQDEYSYVWHKQDISDEMKNIIEDYFPHGEYCYTEVLEDMMEKVVGIVSGTEFETDPMIILDFSEEDMQKLEEFAENEGLTIEETCVKLITEFVERCKKEEINEQNS